VRGERYKTGRAKEFVFEWWEETSREETHLVEKQKKSSCGAVRTTPVCLQYTHSWRIRNARSATLAGLHPYKNGVASSGCR